MAEWLEAFLKKKQSEQNQNGSRQSDSLTVLAYLAYSTESSYGELHRFFYDNTIKQRRGLPPNPMPTTLEGTNVVFINEQNEELGRSPLREVDLEMLEVLYHRERSTYPFPLRIQSGTTSNGPKIVLHPSALYDELNPNRYIATSIKFLMKPAKTF
jgi:hypothetical protein